jgi:zinc/manganese transport system ATP-binding protein
MTPVVEVRDVSLGPAARTLVEGLTFDVGAGEFVAVVGPNGTGKTTLLRALLGLRDPAAGRIRVLGRDPRDARGSIGYVPQQRPFDATATLRARDLVALGLDGHRFGFPRRRGGDAVTRSLRTVDALALADRPIGRLSGGEQQRLRVAQALVSEPRLLLVDEPLLSLDLRAQRVVVDLIERRRRTAGTPVVFVTHDLNPILPFVDRVLYLAGGSWAIGRVDEVMTTDTLSRLFDAEIDVLHVRGRIVVVGVPDEEHHDH